MTNTADFDRSGRPGWGGSPPNDMRGYDHEWHRSCHPASILIVIAGFIVWWPLGLAALAYTLWSRKMGCGHHRYGRFADKMERMQWKMERMRDRMDVRRAATVPSTSTAWRRCAVSRRSRRNSANSSTACVRPRTRKSSTPSWPSTASVQPRPKHLRRRARTAVRPALN